MTKWRILLFCAASTTLAQAAVLRTRRDIGPNDGFTSVRSIAVDAKGFLYQTGSTSSPAFPVSPGPLSRFPGRTSVFVRKLKPDTLDPVYSVLVGGAGGLSVGAAIAVDSGGNVYVTGWTEAPDFPTTPPFTSSPGLKPGAADVFAMKLNPDGTRLLFSRTFGGSGTDTGAAIALAPDARIVLAGSTTSADFSLTANALQPGYPTLSPTAGFGGVGFLARLDQDGMIDFATYLGGEGGARGTDVAVDGAGDIYLAGYAGSSFPTLAGSVAPRAGKGGFAAKVDHVTGRLVYSTYIPNVAIDYYAGEEDRLRIALDSAGHAYFAGGAHPGFLTTPGAFQTEPSTAEGRDAFLMELDDSGRLVFATLFGAGNDTFAAGIAVVGGTVAIAGNTSSYFFPMNDYGMPACNLASIRSITTVYSAFVASFDHLGRLVTSAGYGTCGRDKIASFVQEGNSVFLAGSYLSSIEVGFTAAIDVNRVAPVQMQAIFNSASFVLGALAPLEIVTIAGRGLGPRSGTAAAGAAPVELGGTRVSFNGKLAPILYASANQVNVIVPAAVSSSSWAAVEVTTPEGTSAPILTWMERADMGVFTQNGSGLGQGAILNQDGTVNSASNPAARGSVVSVYATGCGLINPLIADGQIATGVAPLVLGQSIVPTFGGVFGKVLYAGAAPSLINGAAQLNVEVPENAPVGPSVPMMLHVYNEFTSIYYSQFGVTVAIR